MSKHDGEPTESSFPVRLLGQHVFERHFVGTVDGILGLDLPLLTDDKTVVWITLVAMEPLEYCHCLLPFPCGDQPSRRFSQIDEPAAEQQRRDGLNLLWDPPLRTTSMHKEESKPYPRRRCISDHNGQPADADRESSRVRR